RVRMLGLLLAFGLVAQACQRPASAPEGSSAPAPAPAQNLAQRQEFRFSLTGEPPGLDPQYTSWDASIAVLASLFDSLLASDETRTPTDADLQRLRDTVGVRAVDDYTLQIQVIEPRATFLQLAALWPIAPVRKDVVEAHGERWTESGNLIGNGPFRMTEWVHN